jgi:hypothetical protein
VELEGVLREGENADDGVAEAHDLMHRLRVDATQLVGGAHIDLLRAAA